MRAKRERLKVGVTIFLREGAQSLWENGIFQNCFFLVMLLQHSPVVGEVFLVNGGPGRPEEAGSFLEHSPASVIDLQQAQTTLDVIIELSAQLDVNWARAFCERGGRVVGMRVANDYMIDIERMMFSRPQGLLVAGTPYHAIWTLPAFDRSCASYYEYSARGPVTPMPHLWSPMLLERGAGRVVKYTPGRARWRIGVLEPNICMVKTSHIPMLVADLAHRQDPDMIEVLRVYNTLHMKENAQFVGFARSLDVVRHGLASFEARFPIYEVMACHAEAIVSHHWENGQNYLYYEVLYGGYPLIHNSSYLGGCGYRYADFDCEDGALALREAFTTHDLRLDDYRRSAAAFLETLNPLSEANVAHYSAALGRLYD